jgi:hypothetical protein
MSREQSPLPTDKAALPPAPLQDRPGPGKSSGALNLQDGELVLKTEQLM